MCPFVIVPSIPNTAYYRFPIVSRQSSGFEKRFDETASAMTKGRLPTSSQATACGKARTISEARGVYQDQDFCVKIKDKTRGQVKVGVS